MRRFGFLVVICALLGFIAMPAVAKVPGKGTRGARTVIGMVKSIDSSSITISVIKKKGSDLKSRTIKLTNATTFTVNGKAATIAAVTPGESVKITLSHGHTDQVDVTTKGASTTASTTPDATSPSFSTTPTTKPSASAKSGT